LQKNKRFKGLPRPSQETQIGFPLSLLKVEVSLGKPHLQLNLNIRHKEL